MQDVLNISTTRPRAADEAPVNALQNVISNGTAVAGSAIGLHFHDNPTDQVSSLAVIPYFASVAFQNGADVYMPASDPASGTIAFSNAPRGESRGCRC